MNLVNRVKRVKAALSVVVAVAVVVTSAVASVVTALPAQTFKPQKIQPLALTWVWMHKAACKKALSSAQCSVQNASLAKKAMRPSIWTHAKKYVPKDATKAVPMVVVNAANVAAVAVGAVNAASVLTTAIHPAKAL